MASQLIEIDPRRIDVYIVNPNIVLDEDQKVCCSRCGKWLFSMNRKFAFIHLGGPLPASMYNEVPLNVFRMVRFCGQCKTYKIIYLDGQAKDL